MSDHEHVAAHHHRTPAIGHYPYRTPVILAFIALIGVSSALGYLLYRKTQAFRTLAVQQQATQSALDTASSTNEELKQKIAMVETVINDVQNKYFAELKKNSAFESQIKNISQTVGSLDKLANTDPQLLQKYSKVYFLNENYTPAHLTQMSDSFVLKGHTPQFFLTDALPFLQNMITAARMDGVDLQVLSAYRSFDTQTALKAEYKQTYGSGANTFSADQGYSEHQLGTAVDLTDKATDAAQTSFDKSAAFTWLKANAYKYGFEMSYPPGNDYYVYEPWHWRFVGIDLAYHLHENNLNFYDMDQRQISAYLVSLFDTTLSTSSPTSTVGLASPAL